MNNNQIRTRAAIVDLFLAKEDIESLAEDYDLTTDEVRAVIDRVPVDLRKMFARNEFYVEVDGFLVWWPSKTGFVDGYRLRSIADFLDAENAEWVAELDRATTPEQRELDPAFRASNHSEVSL